MLKKIVYSIVAGGFVLAAQAASADSTQFLNGDRYQGVADNPFAAVQSGAEAGRAVVTPAAAPQTLDNTHAGSKGVESVPAPYNTPGGYFN